MEKNETVNKKSHMIDIWITFIIFSAISCIWILYAFFDTLSLIMYSPVEALVFGFVNALFIYFLGVIPLKVIWKHLKK